MKKFISILAAVVIATILLVVGCDGTNGKTTKFTVTFDYNYDGAPAAYTVAVDENTVVTAPSNPLRDKFVFNGWYTTESCAKEADLTAAITADVTFYACWVAAIAEFTVTFDYNYENSPASVTQKAKEGEAVTEIAQPDRDGAIFTGWYKDKECTQTYDFSAAVTGNITVYAGWFEASEGKSLMVFYKNDGTDAIYKAVEFSSAGNGSRVGKPDVNPVRNGYYFDGWYADAECTQTFNFDMRYTENKNVYAAWRKIYTFEAEYTYLTGKKGNGYSGSNSDTGLILTDDTEHKTASNGYYVGWLYYNGAFLDFTFEAEEAADDVTIVFRLSAEYDPLNVTGDQVYVGINEGTEYEEKYDLPLSITGYTLIEHNSYGTKDFANYTVAANVNIRKGTNTISLVINNNIKGSGGTMNAAAPIVDCMYLYTNAELEMNLYTDNIK